MPTPGGGGDVARIGAATYAEPPLILSTAPAAAARGDRNAPASGRVCAPPVRSARGPEEGEDPVVAASTAARAHAPSMRPADGPFAPLICGPREGVGEGKASGGRAAGTLLACFALAAARRRAIDARSQCVPAPAPRPGPISPLEPEKLPFVGVLPGRFKQKQVAGGVRVRKSGCSCQVLDPSGVVRKQAEGGVGGAGGGQKAGLCASSRPWCERLRWMSESQQVRDEVDSLRRILRERKTEVAARDALGKANQYQDVATLGNPAPGDQPSGHAGCRARLPGRACGLGTRMALSPPPRLLSSADLACAQCGGRRS